MSFRNVWFFINYILHCSKCPRLSAYRDFFKYCLSNLCFQLRQNVTWTDKIAPLIRHKWGKTGPSYLLSQHSDGPFYFIFGESLLFLISGQSLKQILCWVLFRGNDLNWTQTSVHCPHSLCYIPGSGFMCAAPRRGLEWHLELNVGNAQRPAAEPD